MSEIFFNLAWLIPLPTLIAFFLIILFTNKKKRLSSNIALAGVFTAWVMSWIVAFVGFFGAEVVLHPFDFSVPWIPAGTTMIWMGVQPLSAWDNSWSQRYGGLSCGIGETA